MSETKTIPAKTHWEFIQHLKSLLEQKGVKFNYIVEDEKQVWAEYFEQAQLPEQSRIDIKAPMSHEELEEKARIWATKVYPTENVSKEKKWELFEQSAAMIGFINGYKLSQQKTKRVSEEEIKEAAKEYQNKFSKDVSDFAYRAFKDGIFWLEEYQKKGE